LSLLPLALLQNGGGGTTDGAVEDAVDAVQDTSREVQRETGGALSGIEEFYRNTVDYLTSAEFFGNIIASIIVVAIGLVAYRLLTHGVPRVLRWRRGRQELLDAEAVARIKRQDTAITLIRNVARYVTFAFIVLFVFSIFIGNPIPATAGAGLVVAIVGFGAQSFLRDMIAGISILFEGQYSVGDFIEVEPTKAAGIVEEFGLRTTKIRALSGEVVYIPNGAMQGVRNYVSGQERFNVEVQVSDEEGAERVVNSLAETSELYLTPPRLVDRQESDGRIRLRVLAGVLPSMAWLVEENLTERLKAAAGEDSLAAEPLVYKVDQANLQRIRNLLPQE
jgi:small conductance mechanosensitive channel